MAFGTRIIFDHEEMQRLGGAVQHVSRGWLPVNPDLLANIHANLQADRYKTSKALVDRISSDFGLMAHVLKSLSHMPEGKLQGLHPINVLRKVPIAELRAIIPENPSDISKHKLMRGSFSQLLFARTSSKSLTAAGRIATEVGAIPEEVYTVEFFRQLGTQLAAWNYPRLFSHALLQTRRSQIDLDSALRRSLGFSPTSLGRSVAQQWRLGNDFLRCSKSVERQPITTNAQHGVEPFTLEKLCEAAEALARTTEPKAFPRAAAQWDAYAAILAPHLSAEKLAGILKEMERNDAAYVREPRLNQPQTSQSKPSPSPAPTPAPEHAPTPPPPRRHIPRSSAFTPEIAKGGLERFIRQVLPSWGFIRGCVYAVEDEAMIPTFVVGEESSSLYAMVSSVVMSEETLPLIQALESNAPRTCINRTMLGRQTSYICGRFGAETQPALLYLELSNDLAHYTSEYQLARFRAAQECLSAFLGG